MAHARIHLLPSFVQDTPGCRRRPDTENRTRVTSLPDPIAKVTVNDVDQCYSTQTRTHTTNPDWEEHFYLHLKEHDVVTISLWDKSVVDEILIGFVRLDYDYVVRIKDSGMHTLDLQPMPLVRNKPPEIDGMGRPTRGHLILSFSSINTNDDVPICFFPLKVGHSSHLPAIPVQHSMFNRKYVSAASSHQTAAAALQLNINPDRTHETWTRDQASTSHPTATLLTSTNNNSKTGQYSQRQKSINKKAFERKLGFLNQEFTKLRMLRGTCKVQVSRNNIFEDSYHELMKLKGKCLRRRLWIKFINEQGVDYGGLAREWLYLLSQEMLDPSYGLFIYSRDDNFFLQINPDSGINPDHLSYFQFVGRAIGLTIFNGLTLDASFSLTVYRQLLGKSISLADVSVVDPDLYRSLAWILNNNITGILDTNFSVDYEVYGERREHVLKPGGKDVRLVEENKKEYIRLYLNWRFTLGIDHQLRMLKKGINEIFPLSLLDSFTERELELLITGIGKINLHDWRLNTRLKNCNPNTNVVRWFWKAVEKFDDETRNRLLQFVTGSSRVPSNGFSSLRGSPRSKNPCRFTIQLVNISTDSLPQARTCFNRLELPSYETYDKLFQKLTCALQETAGFYVD